MVLKGTILLWPAALRGKKCLLFSVVLALVILCKWNGTNAVIKSPVIEFIYNRAELNQPKSHWTKFWTLIVFQVLSKKTTKPTLSSENHICILLDLNFNYNNMLLLCNNYLCYFLYMLVNYVSCSFGLISFITVVFLNCILNSGV